MRTSTITVRTEPEVKELATAILRQLGMNTSEAVNLFLRRVILERGIPFDVRIPNKETIEAMRDIQEGRNLTAYESAEQMFEELGISVK